MKKQIFTILMLIGLSTLIPVSYINAQNQPLNLSKAIELALINNQNYQAQKKIVEKSFALIPSAINLGKTNIYYHYDESNTVVGLPLKTVGVQQSISYPGIYSAQKKTLESVANQQKALLGILRNRLIKQVSQNYNQIVYLQNKISIFNYLDSLYNHFAYAAEKRLQTGETNYLEKLTADSKKMEIHTKLKQTKNDLQISYLELQKLTGIKIPFFIPNKKLIPILVPKIKESGKYYLNSAKAKTKIALNRMKIEKRKFIPDINFEYFQGKTYLKASKAYRGFSVGISLPIWFFPQKSKTKAAKLEYQAAKKRELFQEIAITTKKEQLLKQIDKYLTAINYYNKTGKKLSNALLKMASKSFHHGEIDYVKYILSVKDGTDIRLNYLYNLYQYNLNIIQLKYLEL